MSICKKLFNKNLLKTPYSFVSDVNYEVIMGSFAYGVSNITSDIDVYALCTPPKEMVFPHLDGHISGFGHAPTTFETLNEHHIKDNGKEYDIAIHSIVKYFNLCAENNPNMIDSLFVPDRCVTHMDTIGKLLRENRVKFLHKGSYHKFKGYAYAQMKKIKTKAPTGNRIEFVKKYGYDVKFAYHVVRLALEAEQILVEHDLDLERNREQLKAIRRGEWSLTDLEDWFKRTEIQLDQSYLDSTLRHVPDWDELRRLLLVCLEEKYGSLQNMISTSVDDKLMRKYNAIVDIVNQ